MTNIAIKATNTTLTSNMKAFIEEKLSILEKFLRPEDKIRVEMEVLKKHKSGLVNRAEIEIQPHGYFAEAFAEDFYAALDLAVPKMARQLKKQKEKILTNRKKHPKSK